MDYFNEALMDCKLNELQFTSGKFTWLRGKNSNAMFERLDKGLATEGWFNLFPYSNERHLTTTVSDHTPLLLYINNQQQTMVSAKHQFRFENI